jgi:hypothetical protein
MQGVFQKVVFDGDSLRVNRQVKGFYFHLTKLSNSSKIVLELEIPRRDERSVKVEFIKLLPEWVLEKIHLDWSLRDALSVVSNDENEMVECLLNEAADQFEELLTLEIGQEARGIYFTIRFAKQKVSIWDEVVP